MYVRLSLCDGYMLCDQVTPLLIDGYMLCDQVTPLLIDGYMLCDQVTPLLIVNLSVLFLLGKLSCCTECFARHIYTTLCTIAC